MEDRDRNHPDETADSQPDRKSQTEKNAEVADYNILEEERKKDDQRGGPTP
jgi:hypothetical protein